MTSSTDVKCVAVEFGGDTYGADNFMQQRGNGYATYRTDRLFGPVDGLTGAAASGKNGSVSGEKQEWS